MNNKVYSSVQRKEANYQYIRAVEVIHAESSKVPSLNSVTRRHRVEFFKSSEVSRFVHVVGEDWAKSADFSLQENAQKQRESCSFEKHEEIEEILSGQEEDDKINRH